MTSYSTHPPSWLVHKFGGSSLATAACYSNVADIIESQLLLTTTKAASSDSKPSSSPPHKLMVVISAAGKLTKSAKSLAAHTAEQESDEQLTKVTDRLIEATEAAAAQNPAFKDQVLRLKQRHAHLITTLFPLHSDATRTSLLEALDSDIDDLLAVLRGVWLSRTYTLHSWWFAYGELWSARLLTALLNRRSTGRAIAADPREILFVQWTTEQTDSYKQLQPDWDLTRAKLDSFLNTETVSKAKVVVVGGYLASTSSPPVGRAAPLNLARNGTDFSAAILAVAGRAKLLTIWTDVDGVYDSNPNASPTASTSSNTSGTSTLLEHVSYLHATKLNFLHPSCLVPLHQNNVPLRLRNTFNVSHTGSLISSTPFNQKLPPQAENLELSSPASETTSSEIPSQGDGGALQDDYGGIDLSASHLWQYDGTLQLENGQVLHRPQVRYHSYGKLNAQGSNVVWICHALTGYSDVSSWWGGLIGEGHTFPIDTTKSFVVCANILGSCYGTSGPTSVNPETGKPYGSQFPYVTVRDCVKLHALCARSIGVKSIEAVVGGSLGGMQAIEWALLAHEKSSEELKEAEPSTNELGFPLPIKKLVLLSCAARQSSWAKSFNHVQLETISQLRSLPEATNSNGSPRENSEKAALGNLGLNLARQLAMITYRSHEAYEDKFDSTAAVVPANSDKNAAAAEPHLRYAANIASYLRHQGQKLVQRFDVESYVRLLHMLDSHDVGRGRTSVAHALSQLSLPVLVLGVASDVLYPVKDQLELGALLPNATTHVIESREGHDGFILEQEQITQHLHTFLSRIDSPRAKVFAQTLKFNPLCF